MSNEAPIVEFGAIVDLNQYKRSMDQLEPITASAAKKASAALAKEMTSGQAAAAKQVSALYENATRGAATGLDRVSSSASKAKGLLNDLAGAASHVSPELANMIRVGSDGVDVLGGLAGGGMSLLGVLGPIAVAVGVFALAQRSANQDLAEAETRMEAAAAAASKMQEAVDKLGNTKQLAGLELAVALGEENADTLKNRLAMDKAEVALADVRAQQEARVLETAKKIQALHKGQIGEAVALDHELANRKAELKGIDAQAANLAATLIEKGKADEANAESTKRASQAESEAKRNESERQRQLEELIATSDQWRRAIDVSNQGESLVKFREELEEISKLQTAGAAGGGLGGDEANRARIAALQEFTDAQAAIDEKKTKADAALQKQADARKQAEFDEAMRMQDELLAKRLDVEAQVASAAGNYLGAVRQGLDLIIEKNQEQGKGIQALFAMSKAAAVGEIAINTAVAISKALSQLGPIGGAIASGGIVASGVAQTAVVLSQQPPEPTMHVGGSTANSPPLAPDETTVRVKRTEEVVSHADRDVRGRSSAARPIIIQSVYDGRVFNQMVYDNNKNGGEIRSLATTPGVHPGRRRA